MRGAWHVLRYLGVWSLGLFSPTFFSTSSKKKAISTAVDKAIPTSKSGRPESQPVSDETLALIKEKRRLRRQYSQAHDPFGKDTH